MYVRSVGLVLALVAAKPTLAATNLQVLEPDVNLAAVMAQFNAALGVQCSYCHAGTDYASDVNPKKATARTMLRVMKRISLHFPDAGNDFERSRYLPFPEGKQYVTCATCHRGATTPANTVPDWHGPARAPEPGAPTGRRGRGPAVNADADAGAVAPAAGRDGVPPTEGRQTHKNMVFLPATANTQFVMPAFRAALGVECNFCHVSGAALERGHANQRDDDSNPKKLIARAMVGMVKEINAALFPSDTVDLVLVAASTPPAGTRYVTCYTCHRGARLPAA